MKAVVWDDEGLGAKYHDEEIPADLLEQGEGISHGADRSGGRTRRRRHGRLSRRRGADAKRRCSALIRKAVRGIVFHPVFCGSAFKNKGVQPLLDAVVDFLPSPIDREAIKGVDMDTGEEMVRNPSDSEPFSMLAFKIMDDPFVGTITFAASIRARSSRARPF